MDQLHAILIDANLPVKLLEGESLDNMKRTTTRSSGIHRCLRRRRPNNSRGFLGSRQKLQMDIRDNGALVIDHSDKRTDSQRIQTIIFPTSQTVIHPIEIVGC